MAFFVLFCFAQAAIGYRDASTNFNLITLKTTVVFYPLTVLARFSKPSDIRHTSNKISDGWL